MGESEGNSSTTAALSEFSYLFNLSSTADNTQGILPIVKDAKGQEADNLFTVTSLTKHHY